MKSFSKRVASFAMAAAMVFSLVAVSPADAEAASKYSLSKKSSITAGKTYTYKVKGVSKKQYIKVKMSSGVTVKYGSKKVKYNSTKITGGKTLSLKVKASDKVANYKATLKAIVYNKKNNKRVKGLTTTTKVKCTKLAIKSVEPATMATGETGHKYIVVKFNRALDSLDASEVAIREKNTDLLLTVEKVALASDKKSATLTLLGDAEKSGENFVYATEDYVLSVKKSGVTASMDFCFPAVWSGARVTAVDAGKRTFSVYSTTFTVPTTISVDFQEILGRTVTFWADKNHEVVKLVVAKENVVYDAFEIEYKNNTAEFTSQTSDAKYVAVSGNTAGSIYETEFIKATGKGVQYTLPTNKEKLDYVKLILNPNGTVRNAVYEASMSDHVLVASVADNIVTESKTVSANLKDFTIVKDGKTIAITDIQAGNVVYYNTNDKYAEVYNTTVVGPIANVSDAKVTVAGKDYEYVAGGAKYVENNETKPAYGKDYFAALKKTAKDATLYLNRYGKVVYASGDQGTVATTTRDIVIKDKVKAYKSGLDYYISLPGADGTDVAIPTVKLADLKTFVTSTFKYSKDKNTDGWTKVKSFDSITAPSDILSNVSVTLDPSGSASPSVSADIGDIVTLTLDSSNSKVVGIEVVNHLRTFNTDEAFEKGKATVKCDNNKSYQILSSTPIYEITKDAASVVKTTYGEFAKKTVKTENGSVYVYTDKGNVTKIVINNKSGLVFDENQDTKVTGVVTGRETLDNKITILKLVANGEEMSFVDFTDGAKDNDTANAVSGNVVTVTYGKDSKKVSAITDVSFTNTTTLSDSTTAIAFVANGKINGNELASSVVPTIVQKDGNSWKKLTYGELSSLVSTNDYSKNDVIVKYHTLTDTGLNDAIDNVVVYVVAR